MTKDIIIITSVINPSSNPLGYSSTRSLIDPQGRFEETKNTIDSIKKYFGNSVKIVFCECSILSVDHEKYIRSNVDYFIDITKNEKLYNDSRTNINKGASQCRQILEILKYIETEKIEYENLFFISGRYILNENFNMSYFDNDMNIFKKIKLPEEYESNKIEACYTFFYKIHNSNIEDYKKGLKKTIVISDKKNMSIETILPYYLNNNKYIDVLGVNGVYAPKGESVNA